ncbi:7-carboxy-7-deazaguanine synthase QueE, partial [Pantoea agglomerans]
IRVQGCPVGCSWCDTKHNWEKWTARETALGDILIKTVDSDAWGDAEAATLVSAIAQQGWTSLIVVISGGEPAIYDLR